MEEASRIIDNVDLPNFLTDFTEYKRRYLDFDQIVVLDYETDNEEKGSALNQNNHIVLACWLVVKKDGTVERKHRWADEYALGELEKDIAASDFLIAHNAKFELQWLKRSGVELRNILVWDTMLAEWVIAGNRKWQLGLDATAKRYGLGKKLDLAARLIGLGMSPRDIPRVWLAPYCYRDCDLSLAIFYKQREIAIRDGLLHLIFNRNITTACLADIEFNGAQLDAPKIKEEYEKSVEEFNQLDTELKLLTGGINLSSSKQLGEYLFTTLKFAIPKDFKGKPMVTGTGAPKTNVEAISALKATTVEQAKFLALYKRRNKLVALITKNLEFFQLVCEQKQSTFYCVFNQGFTQTHRLSSSGRAILFDGKKTAKGVQGQNLPRQYKPLFTALAEDEVIMEADGAQLEFRVGVDMSKDEVGTKMIVEGGDVHADTAKVFVDWNAANPQQPHPHFIDLTLKQARQPAKPQTFKPMYGGNGAHPAEQEYCKFFRNKYKQLAEMQKNWTLEVLDKGWMRSPYGMRFYWPGTKMGRSGYIDNTTSIYNYSIQGFATAEIIPIALVYFWQCTKDKPLSIFLTIHDSIVSRVKEGFTDEAKLISKWCFTTAVYNFLREVYNYEFTIPLAAGVKISKHWGDSDEEEIFTVYPDGTEEYQKK